MSKSLEAILGFEAQLGVIEDVLNGIPIETLPAEFFSLTKDNDGGNTGSYTKVEGSKETARRVAYGGPSRRQEQKQVSQVPVTLIHNFENIIHDQKVLNLLRNFDNTARQEKGRQMIDLQTAAFIARFMNSRMLSVASMLNDGTISWDGDDNMLPSTSGATVTVDYQVPAGNKGSLDPLGAGAIITDPWSDPTADIVTDIKQIKNAGTKLTGYTPALALYGENILNFLIENDSIKNVLQSNSGLAAAFSQMEIPSGFLGLDWFDVSGFHFIDAAGTLQSVFDVDRVTFVPSIDRSWYEMLQGSITVPTDITVTADAMEQADSLADAFGMFSYSTLETDPVSIKHLAGDTFLPVLKVPRSIFIADVTP